ncbi:hypothetical protein [Streptomyces sp. NPDC047869]
MFGAYGVPLGVKAGYTTLPEMPYRVLELKLPLVINDVDTQTV